MDERRKVLKSLRKASKEGVLLYKKEKPATPDEIVGVCCVREDAFYNLEFIVKDEAGNVKEMWFGDDKKPKGK